MTAVIQEMSNKLYHEHLSISRSQLMVYLRSPEEYKARYVDCTIEPRHPNDSMVFGTMVDQWLTEDILPSPNLPDGVVELPLECLNKNGGRIASRISAWLHERGEAYRAGTLPEVKKAWTPVEVKRWRTAAAENVKVLTLIDAQIDKSKAARHFLRAESLKQQSIFWEWQGVQCKVRPDFLLMDEAIVDLKTSRGVDARTMQRSCIDYGYDVQAAMCQLAVKELVGEDLPFAIVAVHNEPPYEIEVYQMEDDMISYGRERASDALHGIAADHYHSASHGQVTSLLLPRWANKESNHDN